LKQNGSAEAEPQILECRGLAATFETAALSKTNPCNSTVSHRVPHPCAFCKGGSSPTSGTANFSCAPIPISINRSPSPIRRRNANKPSVSSLVLKLHNPGNQRVQSIVLPLPNIHASLVPRPPL